MATVTSNNRGLLHFFKTFYVTGALVISIECIQLLSSLTYYDFHLPPLKILKISALFLLCLLLVSALAALTFFVIGKILGPHKRAGSYLVFSSEVISTAIFALVFIPAFIIIITKNFPHTMNFFWLRGSGLIPIIVFLVVLICRIFIKGLFTRLIYNIINMLWKPVLALTLVAFIWVSASVVQGGGNDIGSTAGSGAKPNIILITFDTLGAEDMSLYGYHLKTTPFWEELAAESYVFERMYANYNQTLPSVISMLTSKYPWSHGVSGLNERIRKNEKDENIAALLPDYYRAAFVSTTYVKPSFIGMDSQFDYEQWFDMKDYPLLSGLNAVLKRVVHSETSPLAMPLLRHLYFINTSCYLALCDNQGRDLRRSRALYKRS